MVTDNEINKNDVVNAKTIKYLKKQDLKNNKRKSLAKYLRSRYKLNLITLPEYFDRIEKK